MHNNVTVHDRDLVTEPIKSGKLVHYSVPDLNTENTRKSCRIGNNRIPKIPQ